MIEKIDKIGETIQFANENKLDILLKKVSTVNQELDNFKVKKQASTLSDQNFKKVFFFFSYVKWIN